jgi:hypothetical protein
MEGLERWCCERVNKAELYGLTNDTKRMCFNFHNALVDALSSFTTSESKASNFFTHLSLSNRRNSEGIGMHNKRSND